MKIQDTAIAAYQNAVSKGFYDPAPSTESRLLLIHSEVSEACEAIRTDHFAEKGAVNSVLGYYFDEQFQVDFERRIKNTFEDEIADVIIRCLDLTVAMGIDIEAHIAAKMRYNSMRPHKHGKKF